MGIFIVLKGKGGRKIAQQKINLTAFKCYLCLCGYYYIAHAAVFVLKFV